MRSRLALPLLLLLSRSSLAAPAAPDEAGEQALLFERLGTREQILETQHEAASSATRKQALAAYRIARLRELGFTAEPESRLDRAHAFAVALLALRRSAAESNALASELDRVRGERTAMESALIAQALHPSKQDAEPARGKLVRPLAKGIPVALPGLRRDGPTKVELRHDSVDLLARMNDPVRAIAPGLIKRVERLPQGGFAIVTAHADGSTSIVSGLRDVTVDPDVTVSAGQTIGLAGRNLDGAVVISVEIWRGRRAQDAAKLLRIRLGS